VPGCFQVSFSQKNQHKKAIAGVTVKLQYLLQTNEHNDILDTQYITYDEHI